MQEVRQNRAFTDYTPTSQDTKREIKSKTYYTHHLLQSIFPRHRLREETEARGDLSYPIIVGNLMYKLILYEQRAYRWWTLKGSGKLN